MCMSNSKMMRWGETVERSKATSLYSLKWGENSSFSLSIKVEFILNTTAIIDLCFYFFWEQATREMKYINLANFFLKILLWESAMIVSNLLLGNC